MIDRGESLHNVKLNRSGVVLDGRDDDALVVLTATGKETWNLSDCSITKEYD